jgi:hypothetical protein
MARHDRLIAFLEREAEVLRHRIDSLKGSIMPELGVTTEENAPSPEQVMLVEHQARLEEVEGHLSDLRKASDVAA